MVDRPLKKRLKKSSAEPDGQASLVNGKGGRGVMGLNPLVGHKVDRFWADVSFMPPDAACPALDVACTMSTTGGKCFHANMSAVTSIDWHRDRAHLLCSWHVCKEFLQMLRA